jgi:hypothetical protein
VKIIPQLILTSFILASPSIAVSAGLPPWQFGMNKEQVKSFSQFGPYKTFKNGDLETFNGRFHEKKENIQFFFANGRLNRIGVYLGEGTDRDKAIAVFRQAYEILQKDYGPIIIPEEHLSKKSNRVSLSARAIAAAANAYVSGYTHIIPIKQPKDVRVSGAIMTDNVAGAKWYYIAIFFDSP